jgi:hypothetical protein
VRIPTTTAITIAILASACSGGGDGPEQPAEDAAVTGDSSGPSSDASVARDAARAEAGTPSCVPACGPKQICVAGSCKDLPSQCPCPIESYCDLTTNQCVPGCMSDADCQQGRYCDAARTCRDGCRVGSCPANEVCSLSTRICECTSGYHRCAGSCVKEGIASCGPACEVCPTDPFGTASCAASGCQLACKNGYKMCAGSCAACPTDKASSFACSGKSCVAAQCSTGHHVCSGSCVLEDVKSCGASCAACKDATQGACSSGACYGVVDFGYYPSATTCAARCASQGKSCGEVCDIQYTRPNGGQYHQVAGGHYTQQAAYEPWGFLKCSDTPPGGAPTSIRCCCTEQLTGTPKPGCTKHSDCKASEFCWAAKQECYATTNSSCPPGYTYKGQCSNGTQFCAHSGLPAGTTFPFETACPAGTTQRGGFYCSGETRVCVPD